MTQTDYIVIKAKEDGVNVIGLTRGNDTKFHHTEKLDRGEVMIAQFTEHTSAMKIRGKATFIPHMVSCQAKGKNNSSLTHFSGDVFEWRFDDGNTKN